MYDSPRKWFKTYQKELLLLANHRIGRKLLQIDDDLPIFKVLPHAYHKKLPRGEYEATFFNNDIVAEKLFDYLSTPKPLYPNFVQKLHYAYLSSTFNPATGERMGRCSNKSTWASARGASSSDADTAVAEISSQLNGGTYYNYRLFQPFDTSSLTGYASISAANWQGYRDDAQEVGGNGSQNTDSTTLEVVISTEASPTSYASTDYANVSFTSKGSLAISSVGSNNTYTNGGNGVSITDTSIINITGYTKLAVITGKDLNNSAPSGLNCYTVQNRSQANPPKLVVTYTLGSPSSSLSPSISPSASVSPSASRSPSSSISASISPSASRSPSSSVSPSASVSPSNSSSPSPSAGFTDYSRGTYAMLPTGDNDLSTMYTPQEVTKTQTQSNTPSNDPENDIGQEGALQYMIHQFKNFVGNQRVVGVEFFGESTLAPVDSTVYLQIYNRTTNTWDTLDFNDKHPSDVTFELKATDVNVTNYVTPQNTISCRVYQLAI